MHRECVYKLWVSINRPDLSYSHFPFVTLIESQGHFPISKNNTKSIMSQCERSHTVQHNFYTNLDNIFSELMHGECVYKLWASINWPDLGYGLFPIVTLI